MIPPSPWGSCTKFRCKCSKGPQVYGSCTCPILRVFQELWIWQIKHSLATSTVIWLKCSQQCFPSLFLSSFQICLLDGSYPANFSSSFISERLERPKDSLGISVAYLIVGTLKFLSLSYPFFFSQSDTLTAFCSKFHRGHLE